MEVYPLLKTHCVKSSSPSRGYCQVIRSNKIHHYIEQTLRCVKVSYHASEEIKTQNRQTFPSYPAKQLLSLLIITKQTPTVRPNKLLLGISPQRNRNAPQQKPEQDANSNCLEQETFNRAGLDYAMSLHITESTNWGYTPRTSRFMGQVGPQRSYTLQLHFCI